MCSTTRAATILRTTSSNSRCSASARRVMRSIELWFLPCRPRSSYSCSITPRSRAPSVWRASEATRSTCATVWSRTICCLAGTSRSISASSSSGSRLASSSTGSFCTLATRPFCALTGKTRIGSSPSVAATPAHWRRTSSSISPGVFSASHRPSILLSTAMWFLWPASPTTWRQTSRSLLVTPVSAASTNSTACAFGTSDSVSSGSVPIAFSPGVSRITRPCRSSGCGKLMTAWRHFEISTMPFLSSATAWSGSSASNRP